MEGQPLRNLKVPNHEGSFQSRLRSVSWATTIKNVVFVQQPIG